MGAVPLGSVHIERVRRRRKVTCSIAYQTHFILMANLVRNLVTKLIMMLVNQFQRTLIKWFDT